MFSFLGGITGAFLTGLFAEKSWNVNGADGAFYGRPVQLWYQIAGILTAIGISLLLFRASIHHISSKGFAGACTAGILLPLKYTIGIRLSPEEEFRGLDHIGKRKSSLFND